MEELVLTKYNDEQLIALLREQPVYIDASFRILYDRHVHWVLSKAVQFTDKTTAEDLCQDIFVRVFINLEKFSGQSKFSTWLYSITYNACVDHKRKFKNKFSVPLDDQINIPDSLDEQLQKELLQSNVAKLQKAMHLIEPKEQMILLMKYQDGWTIANIAKHLDTSEGAVKMKLKRLRKKVVEKIKAMPDHEN